MIAISRRTFLKALLSLPFLHRLDLNYNTDKPTRGKNPARLLQPTQSWNFGVSGLSFPAHFSIEQGIPGSIHEQYLPIVSKNG